jgi:L-histidine N-alpha-methyltransferase
MRTEDRFLIGADLRKDPAVIEAAYNDSRGVTAEFNRNMLRVLNHELAADFDPDGFDHRAFYDRDAHRIEMHLVARGSHHVLIPGVGEVRFAAGETIRTEISCKHDLPSLAALFTAAGLRLAAWQTDPERRFLLAVGAPV